MGLKISQLPDKAAEDGMMIPASVGGMTYKLLVGIAGGLAKFLHKHEIADVTGLATSLAHITGNGYGASAPNVRYLDDPDQSQFNAALDVHLATISGNETMLLCFYDVPAITGVTFAGRLSNVGDGYAVLRGTNPFGDTVQKVKTAGVWQPWEWVNPPMQVGVEYRTTERYLGKPVYAKLVDFGAMPNATTKNVSHGIANVANVCGACFAYAVPRENGVFVSHPNVTGMLVSNAIIQVRTNTDMTTTTMTVTIKYTKTTD